MNDLSTFLVVGFCGSRHLAGAAFEQCRHLARSVAVSGALVLVGDAPGADRAVRLGAPSATVFRTLGKRRGMFAERSIRLVRALALHTPPACLVAFPLAPCPPALVPSSRPGACFGGFGSGTWATVAFAIGLGVPVRLVLPPAVDPPLVWQGWRLLEFGPLGCVWVHPGAVATAFS